MRKISVLTISALLLMPSARSWSAAVENKPGQVLYSPNADGINDAAVFHLAVSNPANIADWEFEITDLSGRPIKKFTGKKSPPSVLEWNGRDENNRLIPDGKYQYLLSAVTIAGNKVKLPPQDLICDRQAPSAEISVEPRIFSPSEGSAKPTAVFSITADDPNGIQSWLLKVQNPETGAVAKTFYGKGVPEAKITWDGRNDAGDPAPDGDYTFVLAVRDRAGNTTMTTPQTVNMDRAEPAATVDASPSIFSPNGDGSQDLVNFDIKPPAIKKVIETWTLNIKDGQSRQVKTFEGTGEPPRQISWDGHDNRGKTASDGNYFYHFVTVDQAGNRGSTFPKQLILDNTPPEGMATLKPELMSPNADGYTDNGTFDLVVKDANSIRSYLLEVRNDVGEIKKVFRADELPPKQLQWAGQDKNNKLLIDGRYSYTLTVADPAGNKTVSPPQYVQIDVTAPVAEVEAQAHLISPNGDNKESPMLITIQDASGVEAWDFKIKDGQGKVVRQFSGTGEPPSALSWDGKNDKKDMAPDGSYSYVFWSQDKARNAGSTTPKTLVVGAKIPDVSAKAGLPAFSPNADGKKDSVAFDLKVNAFNKIRTWTLMVLEDSGITAREFAGLGNVPAQIIWEGEHDDKSTSMDGVYKYVLKVADEAGNKNETAPQPIRIDTAKPDIEARAEPALFSPNGDTQIDRTVFRLGYQDASPASFWSVAIKNEGDKVVRTLSGKGSVPASIEWDGTGEAKKVLPDGSYTYTLTAEDIVGNFSVTADQILKVDNSAPRLTLAAEPALFAPKSDSDRSFTTFALSAHDASNITRWVIKIANTSGSESHEIKGEGQPPLEVKWEGVNSRNVPFPDGKYSARLHATDEVGNSGVSAAGFVTLDASRPELAVAAQEETVPSLVPDVIPEENERGIVIHLAAEVLFDTAQAFIRPEAFPTLDEAASVLRKYPNRPIVIEGHTDNVPIRTAEFPSNQELSDARAKSIMDYFTGIKKMDTARFSSKGFGESRPIAPNTNPRDRQKNRRVEIVIQKTPKAKAPVAEAPKAQKK